MKILFVGDIVGRPGRQIVAQQLDAIRKEYGIDYVVANGENAAGGRGITRDTANELYAAGVEVLTMGNHVWDNKDILRFIDDEPRLVRPANYPGDCPGRGYAIYSGPRGYRVLIINLSGRVYMNNLDCPFRTADEILRRTQGQYDLALVDFHGEATSEKQAMGWYLDGRVTAVVGTHTHVQTADERLLPNGTAFITDVGMSGPLDSILGVRVDQVLTRFMTQRPAPFEVAAGPVQLDAVCIELDDTTLKPTGITRIRRQMVS
ncbi:MAG: TIGR00282 family metallophosphoesterase [Solirubrobacterales bacterium]